MYLKLNPKLIAAIGVAGIVLICISFFMMLTPQTKSENTVDREKHVGTVSLKLDPDSTSASFSKNNLSDVYLVATNQSSQTIKIAGFNAYYEISSKKVELTFNKNYLAAYGWMWSQDSGFADGLLKIVGTGAGFVELKPNESKNLAKLEINPQTSFSLKLHGDLTKVLNPANINLFNEVDTPETQIFNLSK